MGIPDDQTKHLAQLDMGYPCFAKYLVWSTNMVSYTPNKIQHFI